MTLSNSRVIRISTASLFAGILIGLVGGAFRYCLIAADRGRDALIAWGHGWPYIGRLAPVALGLSGAVLARFLVVRFAPAAEGSGVQHVEAVFSGEVRPAQHSIVLVKFFGGLLAMGSGLALGREGPTVQMGASLSSLFSRLLVKKGLRPKGYRGSWRGRGASGCLQRSHGRIHLRFEELTSSFTPWLLVSTLASASFAGVDHPGDLGDALDFTVQQVSPTHVWRGGPFLLLGALLGVVGALYNAATVGLLRLSDRLPKLYSR